MAANAELTPEEARGRLRQLSKAEQKYMVFVYFCRYYKPDTDQGAPQAEIAAVTDLRQPTISGYIKQVHEDLKIPYPVKDGRGLSGEDIRRRKALLTQYQAVIIADNLLETLPLKKTETEQESTGTTPVITPVSPNDTTPTAQKPIPIEPSSTSSGAEQSHLSVPPQNPVSQASEPTQAEGGMQNIFSQVRQGTAPPPPPSEPQPQSPSQPSPQTPRTRTSRFMILGIVGVIALLAGIAIGSRIGQDGVEIVIQTVVAPQTFEVPVTREVEIEVTRRVIETLVVKETVEVTTPPQVIIQVVTATPDPATSTPELPTVTPLPSATATATPVPLTLPFIDSFDSRRPEWKSITGDSSRVQGKLNIVKGPLKLELPSAGDLKDYTVSFDYSYASYAHIEVYFGSKFRFVFDSHFGGIGCSLQVLTDNNWATPAELPCSRTGNFSIKLSGDDYVLLASNQEIGRANFAVDASRQPISLYVTNEGGTTIDNFTVTAP